MFQLIWYFLNVRLQLFHEIDFISLNASRSSRSSAMSDLQPFSVNAAATTFEPAASYISADWPVGGFYVVANQLMWLQVTLPSGSLTCCCASMLASLFQLLQVDVCSLCARHVYFWMDGWYPTNVEKLFTFFTIHEEEEHACAFLHMSCVLRDLFSDWKVFINFVFWYIIIWRCCRMKVRRLQTGRCHQLQPWNQLSFLWFMF